MATAYDEANIGVGVGLLYYAVFGAAEPATLAETPNPLIWKPAGFTDGGLTEGRTPTIAGQRVDQRRLPVLVAETEVANVYGFSLAEDTLENRQYAYNGGLILDDTDDDVETNTREYRPDRSGILVYRAFLYDYAGPEGRRRLIVRKALNTAGVSTAHTTDGKRLLPVELTSYEVSASIDPYRIIEAVAA